MLDTIHEAPRVVEIFRAPARLHAGNVKEALRAVVASPGSRVVVDLSETASIDSTALGEIVRLHRTLRPSGGEVVLAAPSNGIRRVLAITRLDGLFQVLPDANLSADAASS